MFTCFVRCTLSPPFPSTFQKSSLPLDQEVLGTPHYVWDWKFVNNLFNYVQTWRNFTIKRGVLFTSHSSVVTSFVWFFVWFGVCSKNKAAVVQGGGRLRLNKMTRPVHAKIHQLMMQRQQGPHGESMSSPLTYLFEILPYLWKSLLY